MDLPQRRAAPPPARRVGLNASAARAHPSKRHLLARRVEHHRPPRHSRRIANVNKAAKTHARSPGGIHTSARTASIRRTASTQRVARTCTHPLDVSNKHPPACSRKTPPSPSLAHNDATTYRHAHRHDQANSRNSEANMPELCPSAAYAVNEICLCRADCVPVPCPKCIRSVKFTARAQTLSKVARHTSRRGGRR